MKATEFMVILRAIEAVAENQEVSNEEAAVESTEILEGLSRD
jgi:hypothetical protein